MRVLKYNRETEMSSNLSSKSQELFESMSFSVLQSHVSSLLSKILILWCTETTGTELGEIGKGWKCSLAWPRCGIQRAYSGANIPEWFDINDRLLKKINLCVISKACNRMKVLLAPINLFLNKIERSRGFTFSNVFSRPRIKSRR